MLSRRGPRGAGEQSRAVSRKASLKRARENKQEGDPQGSMPGEDGAEGKRMSRGSRGQGNSFN